MPARFTALLACAAPIALQAQDNPVAVVTVPDLTVVAAPPLAEAIIDVPDFVLVGEPPLDEVIVTVPDLIVVGAPPLAEAVVVVPDMVVVGRPDNQVATISVPDFTVVGAPDLDVAVIDVSDLIVVGAPDEPDNATDGTQPAPVASTVSTPSPAAEPPITETWCNGRYSAFLARPQFVGGGPPIGREETVTVQVTTRDCAQTLEVTPFPGTLVLTRGEGDIFTGEALGDGGQTIVYQLTCQPDLSMIGSLLASDGQMRIAREIEMTRTDGDGADLSNCPAGSGFLVDR